MLHQGSVRLDLQPDELKSAAQRNGASKASIALKWQRPRVQILRAGVANRSSPTRKVFSRLLAAPAVSLTVSEYPVIHTLVAEMRIRLTTRLKVH